MRSTTSARRGVRLTGGLVIVQVALSVLLVTVAGLLVHSMRNLQRVNPGFDASNTLIFRIDPVRSGYDLPRTRTLLEQIQVRLSAIPDVRSVSFSSATLISGGGSSGPARAIGRASRDAQQRRGSGSATPILDHAIDRRRRLFRNSGYPDVAGAGLRAWRHGPGPAGRGDRSRARATTVRGADPIGRQFRWGTTKDAMVMDVIGVCGDTKYTSIRTNAPPTLYTVTGRRAWPPQRSK